MKNKELNSYQLKSTHNKKQKIYIRKSTVQKHRMVDVHWHDYIEIEFLVKGNVIQNLNGMVISGLPGAVYVLRPTDFHGITVEEGSVLYNLGFLETAVSPSILNPLLSYNGSLYAQLTETAVNEVEGILDLMLLEYKLPQKNEFIMQSLLECLVTVLLREVRVPIKQITQSREPVKIAVEYLNTHFTQNPSLESVAELVHYNACHFSTCFHREMGITYSEYLNNLKTRYAKTLLLSTNLNISVVCFKCGFSSTANFARVFKLKTGFSPKQYRMRAVKRKININENINIKGIENNTKK